jgi:uncharacterized protein (DUF736 family)
MAVSEDAMGDLPNRKGDYVMASIGTFKKDGSGYAGSIETLTLRQRSPSSPSRRKGDNAPDFRVFHITEGFSSEIGAAWKKTSREGAEYLSASIDDPSFAERINCRLVKTGSEAGPHALLGASPSPKRQVTPSGRPSGRPFSSLISQQGIRPWPRATTFPSKCPTSTR